MILLSTESARTLCRLYYRGASTFSIAILAWSAALDLPASIFLLGLALCIDGLRYAKRASLDEMRSLADSLRAEPAKYRRPMSGASPIAIVIFLTVTFGGLYITNFLSLELLGAYSDLLQERYASMRAQLDADMARRAYLVDSFGLTFAAALSLYYPASAGTGRPSKGALENIRHAARFMTWREQLYVLVVLILFLLSHSALKIVNLDADPTFGFALFVSVIIAPVVLRVWLETNTYLELYHLIPIQQWDENHARDK